MALSRKLESNILTLILNIYKFEYLDITIPRPRMNIKILLIWGPTTEPLPYYIEYMPFSQVYAHNSKQQNKLVISLPDLLVYFLRNCTH